MTKRERERRGGGTDKGEEGMNWNIKVEGDGLTGCRRMNGIITNVKKKERKGKILDRRNQRLNFD